MTSIHQFTKLFDLFLFWDRGVITKSLEFMNTSCFTKDVLCSLKEVECGILLHYLVNMGNLNNQVERTSIIASVVLQHVDCVAAGFETLGNFLFHISE